MKNHKTKDKINILIFHFDAWCWQKIKLALDPIISLQTSSFPPHPPFMICDGHSRKYRKKKITGTKAEKKLK
jgi:hypothetical protein